jgi:GT2 family glycosyltransferase
VTVVTPAVLEPWVTIVIVNWNKREYVLNLLDSLRSIDYAHRNIIVVDNASTDGSVQAIKEHDLDVVLLENHENMGGTGGFNAGMDYALRSLRQDYLWLLDNDAEVLSGTLSSLVNIMEDDHSIGAAGSCIMSIEDHELIVEAGATIGWRTGTSEPCLRYNRLSTYKGPRVFDVDSVAACSALIRESVVRRVGLMDERYFLHWDDIDFCTQIRNDGHRVVAVLDAPVFHVAEKGYSPAVSYYNFRNSLLFQAKYRSGVALAVAAFTIMGNYLTLCRYLALLGHKHAARHLRAAGDDFISLRFGKSGTSFRGLGSVVTGEMAREDYFQRYDRVLLFAVGSFEDVAAAVKSIKSSWAVASITIVVSTDRAAIYNFPGIDAVITYDLFRERFTAGFKTAIAIIVGRFTCGVTAGERLPLPFAFLVRRNVQFDRRDESFRECRVSPGTLWKIPVAIVVGRILALVHLPQVLASCQAIKSGKL